MHSLPLDPADQPRHLTEIVHRLKIRDAMSTEMVTASPSTPVQQIQLLMKEHRISGVPIARDGHLVGLVSLDDIIRVLDKGVMNDPASAHMTRQIIALEDDMPLAFGLTYMNKFHFGRFPVLNRDKRLVGIITSRDILIALLMELNREAEEREPEHEPATGGTSRRQFSVRQLDFERAGEPTDKIKLMVRDRGADKNLLRRVAVACYELEMNIVVHSVGGTMIATVDPERVEIVATDRGPGIASVEDAMREGFTTAPEWIRSLGFGAGKGLPNAKRMADEFTISSGPSGTTVTVVYTLGANHE